jgi:hypothetical protein
MSNPLRRFIVPICNPRYDKAGALTYIALTSARFFC